MTKKELEKLNLFYYDNKKEKYLMSDNKDWQNILYDNKFEIDKYHYNWYYDALNQILDNFENTKEISITDIEEFNFNIEPDPYTSNLTSWLNNNCHRVYYLTEALEKFDIKDGFQALALAQELEMREVYEILRNSLINYLELYDKQN